MKKDRLKHDFLVRKYKAVKPYLGVALYCLSKYKIRRIWFKNCYKLISRDCKVKEIIKTDEKDKLVFFDDFEKATEYFNSIL